MRKTKNMGFFVFNNLWRDRDRYGCISIGWRQLIASTIPGNTWRLIFRIPRLDSSLAEHFHSFSHTHRGTSSSRRQFKIYCVESFDVDTIIFVSPPRVPENHTHTSTGLLCACIFLVYFSSRIRCAVHKLQNKYTALIMSYKCWLFSTCTMHTHI